LRHVERTRVLVHLLDATAAGPDRAPLKDFDAINRELALFDPALATRPQIVVLNKKDLPDVESVRRKLTTSFARRKIQLLAISAATGDGVQALLEAVWKVIEAQRKKVSTGAAPTPLDQSDSSPHLVRPKELTPRSRPARTASTRPPRGPGRPRER
jgi:GTP-binding protein